MKMVRLALIPFVVLSLVGCAQVGGPATTQPSLAHPDFAMMEKAGWSRSLLNGVMAPDFALLDDDQQFVRLSDLRGKWVIVYFYPSDDTPGCTCQATDFTKQLQAFADLDAVVLGISPDSPQQHKAFRAKYGLGIPLLSDPEGSVCRQYGAWAGTTIDGVSYARVVRSTFVIDPEGQVARHWPEVLPEGHVDRVRQFVAEQVELRAAEARADIRSE